MKLQLSWPLNPHQISQVFGVNEGADYTKVLGTKGHTGIDIVNYYQGVNVSMGMAVMAAHDGEVLAVEDDTNGGHMVVLLTDQAYDYPGAACFFKTIYAHCLAGSIVVRPGDKITRGQHLAMCGSSGVFPGATVENPKYAHVHFGLFPTVWDEAGKYWRNFEYDNGYHGTIDPLPYMDNGENEKIISDSQTAINSINELPIPPAYKNVLYQKVADILIKLKQWITSHGAD